MLAASNAKLILMVDSDMCRPLPDIMMALGWAAVAVTFPPLAEKMFLRIPFVLERLYRSSLAVMSRGASSGSEGRTLINC